MGLSLSGVLPVSAINVGVVAAIPGIEEIIKKLAADITGLQLALEASLEVSLNLPDLPSFGFSFSAYLAALPQNFNPANILTASATVNVDIGIQLGLIEAQIAIVGDLIATLEAGLVPGGIALWTYAGRAGSFGSALELQTKRGFGHVAPTDHIYGAVIATESFESWGSFSATFNTGTTSTEVATTDESKLTFQGFLGGEDLNTGVFELVQPIKLLLLELEGLRLQLLASIQVTLGINLPDINLLLDIAANFSVDLAFDNLINVKVDLVAQIAGLQLQLEILIEFIVSLNLLLSAGGLAVWGYEGPASELGTSLAAEIGVPGIPSGNGPDVPSYGIVLATKLPAVWASFGVIFAS